MCIRHLPKRLSDSPGTITIRIAYLTKTVERTKKLTNEKGTPFYDFLINDGNKRATTERKQRQKITKWNKHPHQQEIMKRGKKIAFNGISSFRSIAQTNSKKNCRRHVPCTVYVCTIEKEQRVVSAQDEYGVI